MYEECPLCGRDTIYNGIHEISCTADADIRYFNHDFYFIAGTECYTIHFKKCIQLHIFIDIDYNRTYFHLNDFSSHDNFEKKFEIARAINHDELRKHIKFLNEGKVWW